MASRFHQWHQEPWLLDTYPPPQGAAMDGHIVVGHIGTVSSPLWTALPYCSLLLLSYAPLVLARQSHGYTRCCVGRGSCAFVSFRALQRLSWRTCSVPRSCTRLLLVIPATRTSPRVTVANRSDAFSHGSSHASQVLSSPSCFTMVV